MAQSLACGVPQGSALGPKLFTIYTLPICDIIKKHNSGFHLYADDTQLYLASRRADGEVTQQQTLQKLEACIAEIWQWMPLNELKLNDSKTEFMVLQSRNVARLSAPNIQIGSDIVVPMTAARNLGVVFDDTLSSCPYVKAICSAAFLLCRITCI